MIGSDEIRSYPTRSLLLQRNKVHKPNRESGAILVKRIKSGAAPAAVNHHSDFSEEFYKESHCIYNIWEGVKLGEPEDLPFPEIKKIRHLGDEVIECEWTLE